MGQTTPNIGIYIPAAGETNYDASFAAGMLNIDQHDHSGGPNKGLPIASSGLADGSVTYPKLNANVADTTTGIGTDTGPNANRLILLGLMNSIYNLGSSGLIVKNGSSANARTITGTAGQIDVLNGDGAGGNPTLSLATGVASKIVKYVYVSTNSNLTGLSTVIPNDNTIPQQTEGNEVLTASITPTNSSNIIYIVVQLSVSSTPGADVASGIALFQDSTANAIAASQFSIPLNGANIGICIPMIQYQKVAGTTSSTTFKVRIGPGSGLNSLILNGASAGAIYGGVINSSILIYELTP